MRIVAAFLIAPLTVPIIEALWAYNSGNVLWDFYLGIGIGIAAGYGFAFVLGVPAYFFYFRNIDRISVGPFLWFILICSAIFFLFWGAIMLLQDGLLSLMSATLWVYGFVFSAATAVSVAVFYLIAFHRFRKSRR